MDKKKDKSIENDLNILIFASSYAKSKRLDNLYNQLFSLVLERNNTLIDNQLITGVGENFGDRLSDFIQSPDNSHCIYVNKLHLSN